MIALYVLLVLMVTCTTAQDTCDLNAVTTAAVRESCPEECVCNYDADKSTVSADCSGQGLLTVPSHIHPCTTDLDMSDCSIPHLMDNNFSSLNLKHITHLKMKNCNISIINVEAFKPLTALAYLDLYGNNITNITNENVPDGLEELDVEKNPLDCNTVKEEFHKVLPQLTVICNGTGVSRLPKDIGRECGIDSECIEFADCQGNECLCKRGYMASTDNKTCLPGLGENCNSTCHTSHAICQDNICACDAMFVPHSMKLDCLPVAPELNAQCVEDIQCSKELGDNVACTDGRCVCKIAHSPQPGQKGCELDAGNRNMPSVATESTTSSTLSTTPPAIAVTKAGTANNHGIEKGETGGSGWIIGLVIGVIVIGGLVVWKRRPILESIRGLSGSN